ncbi:hypothetical protein ACFX13_007104 [Malus domestica]
MSSSSQVADCSHNQQRILVFTNDGKSSSSQVAVCPCRSQQIAGNYVAKPGSKASTKPKNRESPPTLGNYIRR